MMFIMPLAVMTEKQNDNMGVWQGVDMDSLRSTFLRLVGSHPINALRPFQGWPPAERATCGRLLPLWTPHAIRL
jgi:hypothetical protein